MPSFLLIQVGSGMNILVFQLLRKPPTPYVCSVQRSVDPFKIT